MQKLFSGLWGYLVMGHQAETFVFLIVPSFELRLDLDFNISSPEACGIVARLEYQISKIHRCNWYVCNSHSILPTHPWVLHMQCAFKKLRVEECIQIVFSSNCNPVHWSSRFFSWTTLLSHMEISGSNQPAHINGRAWTGLHSSRLRQCLFDFLRHLTRQ